MKKILQLTAVAGLFCLVAVTAQAQRSWDVFAVPRTVILTAPQNINSTTALTPVVLTNNAIDVKLFDGIAAIDVFAYTNSGTSGGTLTFQLFGSPDMTNWTAVANYAVITAPTTFYYTNSWYGSTNLFTTNSVYIPGTVTTPTATTAGWATPYILPAPYTNTGAVTIPSPRSYVKLGASVGDYPRYLQAVWVPGGTITNWTVGATITGMTH